MGQKIADVIFNNMETTEIWNIVILLIQALILIGQLKLSKKINNQAMTREKGYFLIEKTNLDIPKENENDFRDRFNLRTKGKIGFHVIKADVILLSATCIVDGITYKKGQSEEEGRSRRIYCTTVATDIPGFVVKNTQTLCPTTHVFNNIPTASVPTETAKGVK